MITSLYLSNLVWACVVVEKVADVVTRCVKFCQAI